MVNAHSPCAPRYRCLSGCAAGVRGLFVEQINFVLGDFAMTAGINKTAENAGAAPGENTPAAAAQAASAGKSALGGRPVSDETILKVAKEVVVKFIEVGRLSPANFSETFREVHATVRATVRS